MSDQVGAALKGTVEWVKADAGLWVAHLHDDIGRLFYVGSVEEQSEVFFALDGEGSACGRFSRLCDAEAAVARRSSAVASPAGARGLHEGVGR